MSKLREIKKRIGGIREIEGITNAMKLVAMLRLKKMEKGTLQGRNYTQSIKDLLSTVQKGYNSVKKGERSNKAGAVVITSQSGLCGTFNNRVIQTSERFFRTQPCQLIVIGKKGINYFKHRGYEVVKHYAQPSMEELNSVSQQISKNILPFYLENKWNEVYLIYFKFKLGLSDTIILVKLLPLENMGQTELAKNEFLFEPSPREIINNLLPQYIVAQVRQALLESRCSEELERIKAMEYAADNSDKLVGELTQKFNRARQTAITREIYG
ncbi:MAG: ATP synthase F1 subunit gamma [Candidatus Omnitrophica bacterium]|nr:ATP synthase F1 subunit gamma [Candidatus Omnitrophota bacterium]